MKAARLYAKDVYVFFMSASTACIRDDVSNPSDAK
jgi:hypothetical protein